MRSFLFLEEFDKLQESISHKNWSWFKTIKKFGAYFKSQSQRYCIYAYFGIFYYLRSGGSYVIARETITSQSQRKWVS